MILKKINANKLKYDILYRCLCQYIKSKAERDGTIKPKELNLILGAYYHIPKDMRGYLVAELIKIDFFEVLREGKGTSYCYKILM